MQAVCSPRICEKQVDTLDKDCYNRQTWYGRSCLFETEEKKYENANKPPDPGFYPGQHL